MSLWYVESLASSQNDFFRADIVCRFDVIDFFWEPIDQSLSLTESLREPFLDAGIFGAPAMFDDFHVSYVMRAKSTSTVCGFLRSSFRSLHSKFCLAFRSRGDTDAVLGEVWGGVCCTVSIRSSRGFSMRNWST